MAGAMDFGAYNVVLVIELKSLVHTKRLVVNSQRIMPFETPKSDQTAFRGFAMQWNIYVARTDLIIKGWTEGVMSVL